MTEKNNNSVNKDTNEIKNKDTQNNMSENSQNNQTAEYGAILEENEHNTQQNPESRNSESENNTQDLLNKLNELNAQLTEERNTKLRYAADIENLRKRSARDLKIAVDRAKSELLTEFLPVMDHLEMAVEHAEGSANVESLLEGVRMVLNQFKSLLDKFNITEIDATGQKFDPTIHEAMAQAESNEYENGVVIKQWQKGYKLNEKLIRPARVVVSKGPGPEKDEKEVNAEN